ncbi:MAG: hypothetical protein AB6733_06150 [Clostridiaceae bacterium]
MSDRKILLGIGIGMILSTILLFTYNATSTLSKGQIEEKARGLGMNYPEDYKVINRQGE